MIPKLVWCLVISLFIDKNYCSPTERDLYAFTTLANAENQSKIDEKPFGDKNEDTEPAETNIHPDSYGDSTEFSTQNAHLEDSEEDPRGPDDHVIPYSEHENPEEPPTRPDYVAPGVWAKPDPEKNIPLNFVPTKTLAQVRGTHTVKILPQSEALAAATSDEEKLNAPRLREVVSKKKTNTIYTEEGYEDSAYDHAGHIRDADFHEGYARKLHDQRQSEARSGAGRKRKSKKKKSRHKAKKEPEEFEEFTDDYSDEGAPTERYETEGSAQRSEQKKANKIYKNMWKRPDVNPKIVAENEIEKLEHDLKREDEQAERGSENYAGVTMSHGDNDEEDSRDGWSASESRGSRNRSKNPSRTKERIFKENYEATTVEFETPTPGGPVQYEAATSGYENPTTNAYYIPEGSAVQQNYEATTFANDGSNDPHPTTVNYGDIFWKYFKSIPNEAVTPLAFLQDQTTIHQPFLGGEVTTLDPFGEQPSPVAVATINGHGPYLLVSENGGGTQSPYYSSIQSDVQVRNGHQQITPDLNFNDKYDRGTNSRGGLHFPDFIRSSGPVTPAYDSWGFNKGGYNPQELPLISTDSPTTGFYDSLAFSSTPTYSVIKSPLEAFTDHARKTTARIDSRYRNNPFFDSAEDKKQNQDDQVKEKFGSLFKGWSAKDERKIGAKDSAEEDGSESKKKGVNFFGYNPDLKYTKMLGFIKSPKNGRYDGQKSESGESEDFTIMKPPALRESVFSDFTLNSYPNVADYSSASQESEASQEHDDKKFNDRENGTKHNNLLQKDINHKSPSFYGGRPPPAVGRKRLFPASKLLPPEPNSKDDYAEHNYSNRKNGYYKSSKHPNPRYNPNFGSNVQNYNPDPDQLARYLRSRKSPKRQTRSLDETAIREEKIANAVIAQEINARFNFTFEDQGSTLDRNIGELQSEKSKVKRNSIPIKQSKSATEDLSLPIEKRQPIGEKNSSIREKRSHQDLLDASHKITDDVINGEINSRFKNKERELDQKDDRENDDLEDHENEDVEEEEPEKQVEIEEPDLDYLDEVQEVNNIDRIPTTKTPAIDVQKYPYYMNRGVSDSSPLKYIIHPREVPKKTFGGMEFYDSRDKYVQCDEVDPNLEEVVPDDEEPVPNRGPKENLPRLRGLGDKLDCFKAKYFGANPFDSPLFFEKQINQPTPPTELDPIKFATRILELPEENMNYHVPAQSRKPEAASIKRIDYGRRNKNRQNDAEASNSMAAILPRTRKRNSTNHSQLKVSSTGRPRTESRRTRRRRPGQKLQTTTTEAPEINPVTPYQKEVYDDVMGTIKNLASMYEMFEAHTSSPVADVTMAPPYAGLVSNPSNTRNVKMTNKFPTPNRQREKDFQSVGATEGAYTYEEIEGLFPPPELNKNLNPLPHYRSNKIPYNIRFRGERPSRNRDKKLVGYFKTVMVHKRSLDDQSNGLRDRRSENDEHTMKKRAISDSEFEESRTSPQKISPGASTPTTNATPTRGRRRKTSFAATTTTASPVTIGSTRPRSTIRSRHRNTPNDKNNNRYGLFTTTQRTSTTTDARRNEPRYSEITRTRGRTTTTTTPATILPEITARPEISTSSVEKATAEAEEIYKSEHSVPRSRKLSIGHVEPSGEIYKAIASEFEPEHAEEDDEENENYEEGGVVEGEEDGDEEEEEEEQTTDKPEKRIRKYDVHEDVQEDTTSPPVIGFPKPAVKTADHADLSTFLSTDPPGFSEAFPEEAIQRANLDRANNEESYRNAESKDEEVEKDEDEDHTNEKSEDVAYRESESASDEESTESPRSSEAYKDSFNGNVDESGNERNNSEHEDSDDKTFFRFESRPQSPFESFEDDRYSGLGPRVNKPAFHHPPFKAPKYERHHFDDSEEEEKDKADESLEKEKYAFPWAHDEEDEKSEAREEYAEQSTEKYEYPWEKRERLAKQRAQRRKDRESLRKLRDFSFLHDDDEDEEDEDERKSASSVNTGEYVYPWDRYDVPTKSKKKSFWKSGRYDNDEMSSEHRPVAKFSSKYNSSKFKLPFLGSEPISVAEPKEIRESVRKFLREEDQKMTEPTVAYETDVSTTVKPDDLQQTKPADEISTTKEPITRSKSNNRISNSGIIPENITTAPRKRVRSRVTPVRSRTTTLRPTIKTTSEAVTEVSPITSTTSPSTTTKRTTRSRGRSLYKAQESQVATSKISPPPTSTTTSTTETPVRTAVRNTRRGARKREDSTRISNTLNTENLTTKSTPATTTISRRRTRPTATLVTTAKTVSKNYGKSPRRPSRVDAKSRRKETKFDEYNTPVTSPADSVDHDLENSTPTSRTVEHRSRVSKEEIITKTSFPNEDGKYEMYKDKNTAKSLAARKSKNSYSADREKSPFDEKTLENDNPVKNESIEKLSVTTKETPEHFYQTKEVLDKNGHKGMFVSIIPKNQTSGPLALEDELYLRKADLEELERREEGSDSFDEAITRNAESDGDYGRPLTDDSFLLGHVLQKVPPRTSETPEEKNSSSEEYEDSEEDASTEREGLYNSYEESDESENRSDQSAEKSTTKAKFEKDPSKRFYYYLEDKK